MKFIADHWDQVSMVGLALLTGIVLVIKGVREYRSRKDSGPSYAARHRDQT